jgi:hypothetical protein
MKKLLLLCTLSAGIISMEKEEPVVSQDDASPTLIISLVEAFSYGKMKVIKGEDDIPRVCFDSYLDILKAEYEHYKLPLANAIDHIVRISVAGKQLVQDKSRLKNISADYKKKLKLFKQDRYNKDTIPDDGMLLDILTIRFGKFCLNLDLPKADKQKDEHKKIIEARKNWKNIFLIGYTAAIEECLKEPGSFASKMPHLHEIFSSEKDVLASSKEKCLIS